MALIIEDGTIVAGANSYATAAELQAYATARGVNIAAVDPETILLRAMDYLEGLSFIGSRATRDQSLQWPRNNVVIDGFSYAQDELPPSLITAQIETALAVDQGYDPLAPVERAVKRERVEGAVDTTFADNAAPADYAVTIQNALKGLISGVASAGSNFVVERA